MREVTESGDGVSWRFQFEEERLTRFQRFERRLRPRSPEVHLVNCRLDAPEKSELLVVAVGHEAAHAGERLALRLPVGGCQLPVAGCRGGRDASRATGHGDREPGCPTGRVIRRSRRGERTTQFAAPKDLDLSVLLTTSSEG